MGAFAGGSIVNISEEDNSDEYLSSDSDEEESIVSSDEFEAEEDEDIENGVDDIRVNLDITAMIAYVSAMTNGRYGFQFQEKILIEQSEWERQRPVKPLLDQIFHEKLLFCCESAMRDFKTILCTLGGVSEWERGEKVVSRIQVVPDQQSSKTDKLATSGKIKGRSLAIFATGDDMKVVTVAANNGFIRAAAGQGVTFATLTHESGALTEEKEDLTRTILDL